MSWMCDSDVRWSGGGGGGGQWEVSGQPTDFWDQFTITWYSLRCKQGFPAQWAFLLIFQRQLPIKGHMFNVLLTEFPLFNASVQADGNQAIIKKLIAEVFHPHGGAEKCPWTSIEGKWIAYSAVQLHVRQAGILLVIGWSVALFLFISAGASNRYFVPLYETHTQKESNTYEEHKRNCRKQGRQREVGILKYFPKSDCTTLFSSVRHASTQLNIF